MLLVSLVRKTATRRFVRALQLQQCSFRQYSAPGSKCWPHQSLPGLASVDGGHDEGEASHLPKPTSSKKTIFSGIQPTGVPHLGNYLGALQQWVTLQREAEEGTNLIFSVVDLHAITVARDSNHLRRQREHTYAALLAVGLDPVRSTIFYQSAVPQHSELMWILSCQASMGYLSRMTQWKSKMNLAESASLFDESTTAKLKLGLFSYPVLQAADILVHRATHVPVGEDQSQHLEFARQCARSFNSEHGDVLVSPSTMISPAKRVMSLANPTAKMSKSDINPASRIELTDDEGAIREKIRRAVTDSENSVSYDPSRRPGVSNLVEVIFHLDPRGAASPADLAKDFENLPLKALKDRAVRTINSTLLPIRERFEHFLAAEGGRCVSGHASAGGEKAEKSASATMELVREAVGFQ